MLRVNNNFVRGKPFFEIIKNPKLKNKILSQWTLKMYQISHQWTVLTPNIQIKQDHLILIIKLFQETIVEQAAEEVVANRYQV